MCMQWNPGAGVSVVQDSTSIGNIKPPSTMTTRKAFSKARPLSASVAGAWLPGAPGTLGHTRLGLWTGGLYSGAGPSRPLAGGHGGTHASGGKGRLHFLYSSLLLLQRLPHLLGGDGQRHDPHANGIIDGVRYRRSHGEDRRLADTTSTEWPLLIGYLHDKRFNGWEVETGRNLIVQEASREGLALGR